MSSDDTTFHALRELLRRHGAGLSVATDTAERFSLEARPGPTTIAAWRGTIRQATIPVAWVERAKSYVGYHLMGLNGNATLVERLSPALRARLHGKTCFNFRAPDATLLAELDTVTAASIAGLRRAGYLAEEG